MLHERVSAAAEKWSSSDVTFRAAVIAGGGSAGIAGILGADLGSAAGPLISAATFLAAAMVNVLVRVWQWADSNDVRVARLEGRVLAEQPTREDLRARFNALERVQTYSAVAVVLAVVLIADLIVRTVLGDAPEVGLAEVATSSIAIGLSTGVAMLLVGIVAETIVVGASSLRSSRAEVGSQSGPNG